MFLQSFSHQGVRNLTPGKLQLAKGLNIFYGKNGAGKSSLLEAVAFLTTGRSFRTAKIGQIVTDDAEQLIVFAQSETSDMRIGMSYEKNQKVRQVKINGQQQDRLSSLTSLYPTQVISPESYHLIDSGPGERRKYLDWCLFHVKHQYHLVWKNYSMVLKQRNALLRNSFSKSNLPQLDIWDQQLLNFATQINNEREMLLNLLEPIVNQTIRSLNLDFCEKVSLSYYAGYTGDFSLRLLESRASDIERGYTQYGPHKADLRIKVNGTLAKDFLSRGQKKILINALYLSQTQLLKQLTAKDSLFIIDDFTSELDKDNQQAMLTILLSQDNVQILLSCLQQDSLNWLEKGYNSAQLFHVEHGQISLIDPVLKQSRNQ